MHNHVSRQKAEEHKKRALEKRMMRAEEIKLNLRNMNALQKEDEPAGIEVNTPLSTDKESLLKDS